MTNQSQWHTGNVFWSLEKYYDKLIVSYSI